MSETGTDGGSWLATMMLVPLWRIPRTTSISPATRSALDVLVGPVEYDELVERALHPRLVAIRRVSEELEEHNEEAECLVLLDELVAEVDDD